MVEVPRGSLNPFVSQSLLNQVKYSDGLKWENTLSYGRSQSLLNQVKYSDNWRGVDGLPRIFVSIPS